MKIRRLALEKGRHPLQAHAGVDARAGQRRQLPLVPVELHEDVVPDLHHPAAVEVGLAHRPLALVDVDLGAGATRPALAHRPEVVGGAQGQDTGGGQAAHLGPQGGGLVVGRHPLGAAEDRHPEPVRGQVQLVGDEAPGQGDRFFLEVVAEGEVAEHLEEGVVAGAAPHLLEVVVLARHPHALLAGGGAAVGAALGADEDLLEGHHAGVGEHQAGVARRHQRPAVDQGVPVGAEVGEEAAPQRAVGLPAHGASTAARSTLR